MTSSLPSEKPDVSEMENGYQLHPHVGFLKKKEEIDRIDGMAMAQGTTLASFAHLDEKKILRKANLPFNYGIKQRLLIQLQMDIRLIPMLAILYLLSFLDRQ
jgi:hypothetical protein